MIRIADTTDRIEIVPVPGGFIGRSRQGNAIVCGSREEPLPLDELREFLDLLDNTPPEFRGAAVQRQRGANQRESIE